MAALSAGASEPGDKDNFGQVTDAPTDDGYTQISAGLYHGCSQARWLGKLLGFQQERCLDTTTWHYIPSIECGLNLCCGVPEIRG